MKRFKANVEAEGECWVWRGQVNGNVPRFTVTIPSRIGAKNRYGYLSARKAAYMFWVRPDVSGVVLQSICGRRFCVNPWHLREHCRRRKPTTEAEAWVRVAG
jgi:hypothetical protein